MDYKELYELWLTNPYFDEDTRKELEAIKDDNKEIEDRFYKDLEFGTADFVELSEQVLTE